MPAETDAAELRELQRKAYGRGGLLTETEARRLRALEEAALVLRMPESTAPDPDVPDGDLGSVERVTEPEPERLTERVTEPPPVSDETTARAALRRNLRTVLVAAFVLLALGVGAGWALFAPRTDGIPLTDEQQERRAELSAEPFDPGSVRAVAHDDGALAWFATQDDGATICLILDVAETSQSNCVAADDIGLGVSASVPLPGDDAASDADADGTADPIVETVFATLLLSTTGEPMVGIQRWNTQSSMLAQFQAEEQPRAEQLLADGYDRGLAIVGVFREEPVWIGDRLTAQGEIEKCLIVDAGGTVECGPRESVLTSGLGAQIVDVDSTDGAVIAVSVLDVQFTRWQTPYLTVTAGALAAEGAAGDSVVVQAPPGDPIRIEIPNRDTEG